MTLLYFCFRFLVSSLFVWGCVSKLTEGTANSNTTTTTTRKTVQSTVLIIPQRTLPHKPNLCTFLYFVANFGLLYIIGVGWMGDGCGGRWWKWFGHEEGHLPKKTNDNNKITFESVSFCFEEQHECEALPSGLSWRVGAVSGKGWRATVRNYWNISPTHTCGLVQLWEWTLTGLLQTDGWMHFLMLWGGSRCFE